jgi:dolichyl-phosphate-mannose-protein mannosyltransferase
VWTQEQSILDILAEWEWLYAPILFTFLAFFTRNYKIGLSPIVTWDEAQYVHARRCSDDR